MLFRFVERKFWYFALSALLIVPGTHQKVPKGGQLHALMLDQSLEETSAFSL